MRREADLGLDGPASLAWPGFVLDLARGELLDAAGRVVELRAQALRVLVVLGQSAGQVVAKDELLRRVWGDVVVTEDSLVQAIGDIRRALGDGDHRIVRTLPRRGYLLMLPEHVETEARAPAAPDAVAEQAAALQPRRSWAALFGALLLVATVAAAGWAAWPRDTVPLRSLALLPFESEGAADDWFVDAVSNDLGAIVAGWSDARVVGRGTMATYKGKNADPRVVGRELGVRYVLTGRARRDGDRVRLAVSLVDARSGELAWSELRDVPRGELTPLVGDIAGGIARTLTLQLGDAVGASLKALSPHQAQADDLAMQAGAELLRSVSAPAFERARQLAEAALAIDPECRRCLAVSSLAHSNLVLWEWASDPAAMIARAEDRSARLGVLAPDAQLTRMTQASLAHIRKDWAGVLAIGDALVQDFPNDPTSHHHRCSALLRLGRFADSIEACARALRISPRDSRLATWQGLMGFGEYQRGRPAEAEALLRQSVLANPRTPFFGVVLAAAIAEQGRRNEAVQVLQETAARHPDYRRAAITQYWVAADSRFLVGRDRLVAVAGELGLQ